MIQWIIIFAVGTTELYFNRQIAVFCLKGSPSWGMTEGFRLRFARMIVTAQALILVIVACVAFAERLKK